MPIRDPSKTIASRAVPALFDVQSIP